MHSLSIQQGSPNLQNLQNRQHLNKSTQIMIPDYTVAWMEDKIFLHVLWLCVES